MKKLGIVTGRPFRQSIALAVSLAQNGNMPVVSSRDDDDSMDMTQSIQVTIVIDLNCAPVDRAPSLGAGRHFVCLTSGAGIAAKLWRLATRSIIS